MKKKPVFIIGAGGHAKVLIDILSDQDVKIIGIVDQDVKKIGDEILGVKVLGDDKYVYHYSPKEVCLVNGIGSVGSMYLRKKIYSSFHKRGYSFIKVIHPSAIIGKDVKLGEGVQVMAGAIIQTGSIVGVDSIVNTKVSIDHDCFLGNHVHVAPGSTLSGLVKIGDCSHLGTGCIIIQGIRIGKLSLIGAGAVVLKNIDNNVMAVGVPAMEVKHRENME